MYTSLKIIAVLGLLTLSACASTLPETIRKPPPGNPPVDLVRLDMNQYRGAAVRWGGVIARVENRATETWLEIVSQPLSKNGRPSGDDLSRGRFLARIAGFVDPVIYASGRLLTVVGEVEGHITQPVGEFPYQYPIVAVSDYYLWEPELETPAPIYDPFWSPWPWYPHYPWPYYPPRRIHR